MNKDLTASNIQRQNVLNNHFAIKQLESELALGGFTFQGGSFFTKRQVAQILEVDQRTIDRYLHSNNEELTKNGYIVLKGKSLLDFKELLFDNDTNVVIKETNINNLYDLDEIAKTRQLSIFSFKSVLNLAMLLTESERAREIRSRILDIVIDVITKKTGGHTKYINQRDEDYLIAAFQEENYRQNFTDALDHCLNINEPWKYGKYTNMIYKAIFEEDAKEYRKILKLTETDKVRDTFYTEVLDLIAAFEAGFAEALQNKTSDLERKLSITEADALFDSFAKQATLKPLITKAKTIMASRDLTFREALHEKLEHYIREVPKADYERFLGEKSKALEGRIEESLEVYKRLRDR